MLFSTSMPIEGVIKADDDASLRLEIEEYVLTNEVEKRLELFLNTNNNLRRPVYFQDLFNEFGVRV